MDLEVKTRVIKRNGEEVDFRLEKIVNAIKKANEEVENIHRMNDFQIIAIAEKIAQQAEEFTHAVNVEDIWLRPALWRCVVMRLPRSMSAIAIREN